MKLSRLIVAVILAILLVVPAVNAFTVKDESTNQNNGITYGDPEYVTGKIGDALYFDGDDYIVVADTDQDFDITSGVTWTFWMKTTSTVDKQDILCKYVPTGKLNKIFEIGLRNNGQYVWMYLRHQDGSNDANRIIQGNTVVNDGQWHHIAVTYDPSTGNAQIYVDGNLDVSETMDTGNIVIGSESLYIGVFPYGFTKYYNGDLDEVRVYGKILSVTEISNLASEGDVAGYISYWKFDQDSQSGSGTNPQNDPNPKDKEIPEFPTVAIPVGIALLTGLFLFRRK